MIFMAKAFSKALCVLGAAAAAFAVLEAKASKGNCTGEPDCLLILGCRVRGWRAEEMLQMRIEAAARYLTEHKNTVAICCGGIVHHDQYRSEAEVIREGLLAAGISEDRLILEDRSTITTENFVNAKKLIGARGTVNDLKIAYLSSDFHLLRSGVIAKRAGVKAESIAAPSPKNELLKNYVREFICLPAAFFGK